MFWPREIPLLESHDGDQLIHRSPKLYGQTLVGARTSATLAICSHSLMGDVLYHFRPSVLDIALACKAICIRIITLFFEGNVFQFAGRGLALSTLSSMPRDRTAMIRNLAMRFESDKAKETFDGIVKMVPNMKALTLVMELIEYQYGSRRIRFARHKHKLRYAIGMCEMRDTFAKMKPAPADCVNRCDFPL